jgi:hypothetical protein
MPLRATGWMSQCSSCSSPATDCPPDRWTWRRAAGPATIEGQSLREIPECYGDPKFAAPRESTSSIKVFARLRIRTRVAGRATAEKSSTNPSQIRSTPAIHVTPKPYPKSPAGRCVIPLPSMVSDLLQRYRDRYGTGPAGEVFTNEAGTPLRRTLLRARRCRPALVQAALLGAVTEEGEKFRATWPTPTGTCPRCSRPQYRQ